jgi:uncharacterized phage protein (TIGR01671 family)
MSNTYKFRGKRVDNGEWVFGFYLKSASTFIAVDDGLTDGHFDLFEVISETVGQFTGLCDKNGKEIYEGNIISSETGNFQNTGCGIVYAYKGMFVCFYGQDAIGRDCYDELHSVCAEREIIGNIHFNSELLGTSNA